MRCWTEEKERYRKEKKRNRQRETEQEMLQEGQKGRIIVDRTRTQRYRQKGKTRKNRRGEL